MLVAFAKRLSEAREVVNWTQEKLAEKAGLSENTIKNVEGGKSGNAATRWLIVEAIDAEHKKLFGTPFVWSAPTGRKSDGKHVPPGQRKRAAENRLYCCAFREACRRYEAFSNKALDDEAANMSIEMSEECSNAGLLAEAAFWAGKAASAYRRQGRLFFAGDFYGRAFRHLKLALRQTPGDPVLHALELQLEFGRVIAEDFLNKGHFQIALTHHEKLAGDADLILARKPRNEIADELELRRIHFVRQQAEMLRYMGDYQSALAKIREAKAAYPESADEAIRYSTLHEADGLRLLGRLSEADSIYRRLQKIASERDIDGFLGSVLWRRAGALQLLGNGDEFQQVLAAFERLEEHDGMRHKYLAIYSRLIRAVSCLPSARKAESLVEHAIKLGHLGELDRRTEFAHCVLILAEARRCLNRRADAAKLYSQAMDLYRRMPMNWGIVRAWVGLSLTSKSAGAVPSGLQGVDKELLKRFRAKAKFSPGSLAVGFP